MADQRLLLLGAATFLAALAAPSVVAAQPSVEADGGDITLVVEAGQNVGYRIGDKTVKFADMENFPSEWRSYSNAMLRAVNLGRDLAPKPAKAPPAPAPAPAPTAWDSASGLPGFEGRSFSEIEKLAAGGTVNFWMWGGSAKINKWVDEWLQERVRTKYQITIKRGADQGAGFAVAQVAGEMKNPRTTKCPVSSPAPCGGAVDLVWINKENFRAMKGADNLYGPWANMVPSSKNYNWFSPAIAFDAGTPTQGYEMPYNTAQVVFFHNTKALSKAARPKDLPALIGWIKGKQGAFQYAGADDFTGMVFIQQVFYHYAGAAAGGSWQDFLGDFDAGLYSKRAPAVWKVLREIEPYLHGKGTYPKTSVEVNTLFENGDIDMHLSYDISHASTNILNGKYEATTDSYVLDTGTIANTNFVAIPVNAQNKAAAVVVGNVIASMEAIFTRAQPERWGALPAFDANDPKIVESGWDAAFDYITRHHATPTVEDLAAGRLAEISLVYFDKIKADWKLCVVQKAQTSACGF